MKTETPESKAETAFVVDTNAISMPRSHDIATGTNQVNGLPTGIKRYTLSADTPTEMPLDHALKFLKDPSFIVSDAAGKIMKPMASREHTTGIRIPEGFVLAEWDELSKDALYMRCKVLSGSEAIHPLKTSKELMVEFLVKAEKAKIGNKQLGDTPELSRQELDRMFEEAA